MNKKNNRKGFTIVELVIVIAVIGILATVLVPTFSGIVTDATKAAVKQDAKAIYNSYVAEDAKDGTITTTCVVKVVRNSKTYYVQVTNGAIGDFVDSVDVNTFVVSQNGSNFTGATGATGTGETFPSN